MFKFYPLSLLAACTTQGTVGLSPVSSEGSDSWLDTGPSGGDFVTDFSWCIDFEDGVLDGVGYAGSQANLGNGAVVSNINKGEEFSALRGEELISFREERAVLMRSNTSGLLEGFSVLSTDYFVVDKPMLSWWQISEVRGEGLWMAADFMDEEGYVLASLEIPVETGGHIPGRFAHQASIDELDEIQIGPGQVGGFVGQWVDMSDLMGQNIQVRFYQYTRIPQNAFFTLIDDLCLGPTEELDEVEALMLSDPMDWGF